jgi:uncharacterized membrane protein YdjX (TVP38/TMEM64 family)
MTFAGGALFGIIGGTLIVSFASTTTAALAFLFARYFAREAVERKAKEYPKFRAIDRAVGEGGWKIVALVRLSPLMPFNVLNYLLGLTPIGFWTATVTSWLAMLPVTVLYVYLGYLGKTGLSAASGEPSEQGPWEWTFLIAGLLATLWVTIYVTRLARKALQEIPETGELEDTPKPNLSR